MLRLGLDDQSIPALPTDEQFGTEPGCRVRQQLPARRRTGPAEGAAPFAVDPALWPTDRLGAAPTVDFKDAAAWAGFVAEKRLSHAAVVFCVARYAALAGWHKVAFPHAVQQLVRLVAPTAMFDALASLAPASGTAAYMVRFVGLLSAPMVRNLVAYAMATADACLQLELGPKRVESVWAEPQTKKRAVEYAERIVRDGGVVPRRVDAPERVIPAVATTARALALAASWGVSVIGLRSPDVAPGDVSGKWYGVQLYATDAIFLVDNPNPRQGQDRSAVLRLEKTGQLVVGTTTLPWAPRGQPHTRVVIALICDRRVPVSYLVIGGIRVSLPFWGPDLRVIKASNIPGTVRRIPASALSRLGVYGYTNEPGYSQGQLIAVDDLPP